MPLRPAVLLLLLAAPAAHAQSAPGAADRADDDALRAVNPIPPTPEEARALAVERRRHLQTLSRVGNLPFRNVGPRVMSGRVADLEASPTDPATFYVGYASGGLWRTTSNGTAFEPLFDHESVMTIGDFAVDWADPEGDGETIWLGTGESNSSRSSYAGDGVYRSTDGGQTWTHLGLGESHHVGRLLVHPDDPNTAWVAALGHLYSPNAERGVYRTTDGGVTWEKTLFVDENTGATDLVLDPSDPNTLWAATWTRARRAWDFAEAGPGSAVWRSDDGGTTWARVTTEGSGFPTGETVGRIGLAVAPGGALVAVVDNQARRPEDPDEDAPDLTRDDLETMTQAQFLELAEDALNDFLDRNGFPLSYTAESILEMVRDGTLEPIDLVHYLEDANRELFDTPVVGAEVYRSDDGGATWTRTHDDFIDDLFFSYGYYFGQVRVAPHDADRIYLLGVPLIASSDGGQTWESIDGPHVHVDHHALFVSPTRPGHLINGNDGGVNVSFDDGASWSKANVPAVGQFYTVAYDMAEPYRVYGGLQDNGVWRGPSTYEESTSWRGEGDYPWERVLGGDGMQIEVDPRTNETIFTGFQFGNYFRVDGETGAADRITPRHELGERPLRFNWQTPIHLSRHNQDILYLGSNKLHRSF
ncbi:MAG: glycosyl hydrolase, partial [Rubricoccaceae bacterium]|nr:glycosyl hydrolase [Rubricoccaceae bacterium]